MRNVWKTAAIVLLLTIAAGCGFKDIDKRFFVVVIGVDKGEEKPYNVSLKLAIPSPQIRPGEAKSTIISVEGDTVAEAVNYMEAEVDKELDFGHAKMIVFGESVAGQAMKEEIDWFIRRRDIQQVSYVGVGRPSAEAILKQEPKSERLAGNTLFLSFDEEGTETPYIVTEFLFDFYRRWKEHGKDPYMPVIETLRDAYRIRQVAVFNREGMKAVLSPEETAAFHQLVRQYPQFLVRTPGGDRPFVFSAQSLKIRYSFASGGGGPTVRVRAAVTGYAEETSEELYDRQWSMLEKQVGDILDQKYTALLEKLRDLNVDPIGLGLKYVATKRGGERDWEEWRSMYPRVRFDVDVDVKMHGTGLLE